MYFPTQPLQPEAQDRNTSPAQIRVATVMVELELIVVVERTDKYFTVDRDFILT